MSPNNQDPRRTSRASTVHLLEPALPGEHVPPFAGASCSPGPTILLMLTVSTFGNAGAVKLEPMLKTTNLRSATTQTSSVSASLFTVTIYVAAFITGAIVMSFEMLGSRYLNPFFGSGIYTWAALISTVLIALAAGYFLGGALADRTASPAVLALTVIIGSLYLLALPSFAQAILEFVLAGVDDIRAGSLISSLALMFFPVTFLGM